MPFANSAFTSTSIPHHIQISKCAFPRRALVRAQILRATAVNSPLPSRYYKSISHQLSDAFEAGAYLKEGGKGDAQNPSAPPNPLSDPAAMDGMMAGMKTQMVMMVPQMVIMGWVNFFFQGFVASKSLVARARNQ